MELSLQRKELISENRGTLLQTTSQHHFCSRGSNEALITGVILINVNKGEDGQTFLYRS